MIGNSIVYIGGDILTKVDGSMITDYNSLATLLETEHQVGDEVVITLIQDGQERELNITLTEEPVKR
jgi:S1-C subfamily serine protease